MSVSIRLFLHPWPLELGSQTFIDHARRQHPLTKGVESARRLVGSHAQTGLVHDQIDGLLADMTPPVVRVGKERLHGNKLTAIIWGRPRRSAASFRGLMGIVDAMMAGTVMADL